MTGLGDGEAQEVAGNRTSKCPPILSDRHAVVNIEACEMRVNVDSCVNVTKFAACIALAAGRQLSFKGNQFRGH